KFLPHSSLPLNPDPRPAIGRFDYALPGRVFQWNANKRGQSRAMDKAALLWSFSLDSRLKTQWFRCNDVARLGRRRHRARLYRLPLCRRELWRSHGRQYGTEKRPPAYLSVIACRLLHVMDVLRLGRARLQAGIRFSYDLRRAGADDRPRLSAA